VHHGSAWTYGLTARSPSQSSTPCSRTRG
jgi:hypothetical protein